MNAVGKVGVIFLVALLATVVGCGVGAKKMVKVTGKVVDGDKPFALEGRDYQEGAAYVEVRFYPLGDSGAVDPNATSHSARLNTDGTFALAGETGKGIQVGKYKATLTHQGGEASRRMKGGGAAQGDLFEGKFSLDKTPFTFDIQAAQEVVLDIAQAAAAAPAKS